MEIRKSTLSDQKELIALEKACFGEDCWEDGVWQDILSDPVRNIIYLATENEEIASFLAVYNWNPERNFVKITNAGTKPCFRGKGYIRQLFETMLAEMRNLGMTAFAGETRVSNLPMQHVFRNFNFQAVETMKGYYENPDEDALRYALSEG